jgi:hypothetical protein
MDPREARPALVPVTGGDSIESLFKLAEPLVKSGFLPDYIKTPGQAVAIIMAGREMGVQPMQALRSINLVKGKITINADLQLALFVRDGGQFKWLQDDLYGAKIWLRHPTGSEYTSPFSQQDAKTAGLWGKNTWALYPRPMMRARAITAGLKAVGYEPVSGAYDDVSVELPGAPVPAYVPDATPTLSDDVVDAATGEVTQEAVTGYTRVTDLAVAKALVLPFPNIEGKPLDTLSSGHLRRIEEWILRQREIKSDEEFMIAATDSIGLLLAHREVADERTGMAEPDETSTFMGDEYPATDIGAEHPATAPAPAAPHPTSRVARTQRINELLKHAACANDRADVKRRLTNGMTDHELGVTLSALESKVLQAEPPEKKGGGKREFSMGAPLPGEDGLAIDDKRASKSPQEHGH